MKIFLTALTLCMTLCWIPCGASITKADTMQEAFQQFQDADAKTLAIFDVDMVLIQPSEPAFQMANIKRFGPIAKRIMKEVPEDKQMVFLSLMTLSSDPILVDEQTPQLLNALMQRGVPTMALTANLTGSVGKVPSMEAWRVDGLKKLSIDFSKSAPCSDQFVFNELPGFRNFYSTYINGIFFVNGMSVSKGEALIAFLKRSSSSPNKIIFIDDREENLKSVEESLRALHPTIEYRGIHYVGASHYPSKQIEEAEFISKWQKLASEVKEME